MGAFATIFGVALGLALTALASITFWLLCERPVDQRNKKTSLIIQCRAFLPQPL
jgi:peptidoglycan/LPS O-acetylase OafA/YrhL